MMVAYENDTLVIPEEYKKMSVSELEKEKKRMLQELKEKKEDKKIIKENKNHVVFKFH